MRVHVSIHDVSPAWEREVEDALAMAAVEAAVQSLVLPMVMMCVHKHSLGACGPAESWIDPRRFVEQHVDLIVRGLAPDAPATAVARPFHTRLSE